MKVNLKGTLVLKDLGRVGPGEVEMSDERAASLGLKPAAAAKSEKAAAPKPPAADPFAGLSEAQATALKDAGFNTAKRLRKGLDAGEVQAISGIGTAAVEKLEANLKG